MKKLPFMIIDAFASEKSSGNPAGFVRLDSFEEITAEQMLGIAALRFKSGGIREEWRLSLGGTLTGDIELVELDGGSAIQAVVDGEEVIVPLR